MQPYQAKEPYASRTALLLCLRGRFLLYLSFSAQRTASIASFA